MMVPPMNVIDARKDMTMTTERPWLKVGARVAVESRGGWSTTTIKSDGKKYAIPDTGIRFDMTQLGDEIHRRGTSTWDYGSTLYPVDHPKFLEAARQLQI